MSDVCHHCKVRIVKINFALGARWMHEPEGSSGFDSWYQFCKITVAEPKDPESLASSIGMGKEEYQIICERPDVHGSHPAGQLLGVPVRCLGNIVLPNENLILNQMLTSLVNARLAGGNITAHQWDELWIQAESLVNGVKE